MNRTRRTLVRALRTYARDEIVTESRGKGRAIDVIVTRLNRRAGADEELAKNVRTMNFRRIGMGMMRCRAGIVVTWNAVFAVMLRFGANAQIAATLERPNCPGVKYRQAV
jgi:hypothetical protein